jgi:hypothetical protein
MKTLLRVCLAMPFLATDALAQRTIDLDAGEPRTIAEPFTHIAGVRSLPGNRVIVTDQVERRVFLADFGTGARRQLGREGAGPGEYRFPMAPLAGIDGTTWILDAVLRRVFTISSDGRIGASLPAPYNAVRAGLIAARGVDRSGQIYFEGNSFDGETGRFSDSVAIVRWDPDNNQPAVVARVWSGGRLLVEREGGPASIARSVTPFPAVDAWVVLPDGRIAIVRQQPHELRFTGGATAAATSTLPPARKIPVTAAERTAFRAREEGTRMMSAGGGQAVRRPPTPDALFPESMPAFIAASVVASPEGEIWIGRSFASTERTRRYDVFDGNGRLVSVATLRADRAVVGFGDGVVFVARTDPDDHLVYLERFTR